MPLTQLGKWTVLYSIVGLEVAAGGVCYYYWRRMNTSQGAVIPTMVNLAMVILYARVHIHHCICTVFNSMRHHINYMQLFHALILSPDQLGFTYASCIRW